MQDDLGIGNTSERDEEENGCVLQRAFGNRGNESFGATHVRRAEAPPNAPQINPNQAVPKEGTSGIRGDISTDKERDDDDVDTAPTPMSFRKQSSPKDSIDVHPDSIFPIQDDASVVELVERMGSELREPRSDIQRLSTQVRIGAAYESVET